MSYNGFKQLRSLLVVVLFFVNFILSLKYGEFRDGSPVVCAFFVSTFATGAVMWLCWVAGPDLEDSK